MLSERIAVVARSAFPLRHATAKRASQSSVSRLGRIENALSERRSERSPSRSAAGVASGAE
jgi:hypothetical protein